MVKMENPKIQPHKNGKREKRKEEKEFDGGKDNRSIIVEDPNNSTQSRLWPNPKYGMVSLGMQTQLSP